MIRSGHQLSAFRQRDVGSGDEVADLLAIDVDLDLVRDVQSVDLDLDQVGLDQDDCVWVSLADSDNRDLEDNLLCLLYTSDAADE